MGTVMPFNMQTKSSVRQTDAEIFFGILENRQITPVYQPVVSLTDGEVFGYEALSRILVKDASLNIEQLFKISDRIDMSWELETLCRTKALESAKYMNTEKKLFLNVNPNTIHDAEFKKGFTKDRLDEYGLDISNIVFEITERVAIADPNTFLNLIEHYREQNYVIAIDDVGSGYSGLNAINSIMPDIIKLDRSLIRDVDKDETKRFLCKAMIDFCKNVGIKMVAEGIETEEELQTLIKLDVEYGQGYFLGVPRKSFANIAYDKIEMIKKYNTKKYVEKVRSSVYPVIGNLSKKGYCFSKEEKVEQIYETLRLNPTITEFTIVEDNEAIGFMTRMAFSEIFGGRYGYSLFSRKIIQEVMNTNFLKVNHNTPVNHVSRLAMQRPFENLYNPIVVEQEGKYSGIVTVKDLLDSCTKVEIDIAMHSNPLTGLPGNILIEKEISSRIFGEQPYCIIYHDIDNFKAYNDAYGFKNGDLMLELVANILRECAINDEFIGHIGGDDFVVVCDYHKAEPFCKSVLNNFSLKVPSLYREEDVKNGYIISKNRHGITENFPIATLSIAGISNKAKTYENTDEFSKDIAQVKKKCKKHIGNYFEIL
ncbi:MAG: GGDEF domain-containing protein [Fibromonadaceae bacterium]|jgi:EAL domain-containing protein (putative c-di-GMP-specific phosphodiesterase class I)/GGDEF domain-containing protein|nr:GGDEF domain-containing protein [Fibromonadaceae bacterium]